MKINKTQKFVKTKNQKNRNEQYTDNILLTDNPTNANEMQFSFIYVTAKDENSVQILLLNFPTMTMECHSIYLSSLPFCSSIL